MRFVDGIDQGTASVAGRGAGEWSVMGSGEAAKFVGAVCLSSVLPLDPIPML